MNRSRSTETPKTKGHGTGAFRRPPRARGENERRGRGQLTCRRGSSWGGRRSRAARTPAPSRAPGPAAPPPNRPGPPAPPPLAVAAPWPIRPPGRPGSCGQVGCRSLDRFATPSASCGTEAEELEAAIRFLLGLVTPRSPNSIRRRWRGKERKRKNAIIWVWRDEMSIVCPDSIHDMRWSVDRTAETVRDYAIHSW